MCASSQRLEALEFDAMGAMLGLDGALVASRADAVRRAMSEWRNPELLFRYRPATPHVGVHSWTGLGLPDG